MDLLTVIPDEQLTGMPLPRLQGICWHDWEREATVVAYVPLNWIIGLSRKIWISLKRGPTPAERDALYSKIYGEINSKFGARYTEFQDAVWAQFKTKVEERAAELSRTWIDSSIAKLDKVIEKHKEP